jgi:hypothetical protein
MKPLRGMLLVALLLMVATAGCATSQDMERTQPTGNYWPLDSLAMTYADPVAVSPVHDHPLRWFGYGLHPVGVVLDYVVNRPIYAIASAFPGLFGYTAEDAGHVARRSGQTYQ